MATSGLDFFGTLASNSIAIIVLGYMVKYFISELAKKDADIKSLMVEFKSDIKSMTSEGREERGKIVDKFTSAIDRLNQSIQEVLHVRDGKDGRDGRDSR